MEPNKLYDEYDDDEYDARRVTRRFEHRRGPHRPPLRRQTSIINSQNIKVLALFLFVAKQCSLRSVGCACEQM